MRIRNGNDADAAAAAAVVQRVLHEHGLPFEPRGLDADILAPSAHYGARLTLTTRHRYDRAIRLYERAGFRPAGSAREPRAGDPGLTYALRLAPERDRVPSRPAGGRRRLVLVPSFA